MSKENAGLEHLWPGVVQFPINVPWAACPGMPGRNESQSKGRSGSLWRDFQPYYPGADLRRLNWKRLARDPRHPVLTEYESETRLTVSVLTDLSPGMDFGGQALTKQELAALLTGSLLKSAGQTRELGRLVCFSAERVELVCPEAGAEPAGKLALPAVESVLAHTHIHKESQLPAGQGPALALRHLPGSRSLVFVVSDFHWLLRQGAQAEQNRQALAAAAARHEVICFVVQDLAERMLPELKLFGRLTLPGFVAVKSGDTAGSTTVFAGRRNRAEYSARFAAWQDEICRFFEDNRCKCAIFRTEEDDDARRERILHVLSSDRLHSLVDQGLGNPDVYGSVPEVQRAPAGKRS